jgi:hypothetical protein
LILRRQLRDGNELVSRLRRLWLRLRLLRNGGRAQKQRDRQNTQKKGSVSPCLRGSFQKESHLFIQGKVKGVELCALFFEVNA